MVYGIAAFSPRIKDAVLASSSTKSKRIGSAHRIPKRPEQSNSGLPTLARRLNERMMGKLQIGNVQGDPMIGGR
jgi:hypothetical protein